MTAWDVSLVFGQVLGDQADGKPVIEEHTQITLTRETAKALAGILSGFIRSYEKQAGELKVPKAKRAEKPEEEDKEKEEDKED